MQNEFSFNRRIDAPIEFRGFKAHYILYAGGLLVGDVLFFAIMYLCRVDSWICVVLSFGIGSAGISMLYKRCKKYGPYGWAKKMAVKRMPSSIRCKSRIIFTHLKK